MKLVIYARISSIKQSENSIEAQIRVCRAWAKSNDHIVVREYIDLAQSARNSKRDEFQRMIKAVLTGQADGILVHKLDRFARNRQDSITYKAMLRRKGKEIISVSQPIGDGPTDRLLEGILETIDEFYLLNLASETQKGLRNLAANGIFPQRPPLGYYRENKLAHIDPVRGPLVTEIISDYATGNYTLRKLAGAAWDRGLASNTGKRVLPGNWGKLLHNRFYIGEIHWRGEVFAGKHTPLTDETTFDRVRDLLAERSTGGAATRREYRFTGYLFSAVHNRLMTGNTVRRKFTYYRAKGDGPEHNIREKDAESIVGHVLRKISICEPDVIPAGSPRLSLAIRVASVAWDIYRNINDDEKTDFLSLALERIEINKKNEPVRVITKPGFVLD